MKPRLKLKKPGRAALALLLCWLVTAGAIAALAWSSRKTVYRGESAHWRATYSVRETGDPARDPAEGVFVLCYTGDRDAYKSCRSVHYRLSRMGNAWEHTLELEEGEQLPTRFTDRHRLDWSHTQLVALEVEVTLGDDPPERLILSRR